MSAISRLAFRGPHGMYEWRHLEFHIQLLLLKRRERLITHMHHKSTLIDSLHMRISRIPRAGSTCNIDYTPFIKKFLVRTLQWHKQDCVMLHLYSIIASLKSTNKSGGGTAPRRKNTQCSPAENSPAPSLLWQCLLQADKTPGENIGKTIRNVLSATCRVLSQPLSFTKTTTSKIFSECPSFNSHSKI